MYYLVCLVGRPHAQKVISPVHLSGKLEFIESFELEETLRGHIVQLPCSEKGQLQLY